jgi:hypothetical protein
MPADPLSIVLPENLLMKNRFCCCLSVTLIQSSTDGAFVSGAVFVTNLVRITECVLLDQYSNE